MISIGNDIVDLSAIDKHRTQQKAFYSKILSDKEQQLYSRSSQIPFEIYVWLLWSAKESVYKFAKRLDPELVFSPARIEVSEPVFESEFRELKNFQNVTLPETGFNILFQFRKSFNSENSNSDHISEYNYQINYRSETYYLHSLISDNFIATISSDSKDFSKVSWGIKYIDATDYDTQSQTVRDFVMERLEQIYPDIKINITKSEVGYPLILNDAIGSNILLSFAHHGQYVSYAFAY